MVRASGIYEASDEEREGLCEEVVTERNLRGTALSLILHRFFPSVRTLNIILPLSSPLFISLFPFCLCVSLSLQLRKALEDLSSRSGDLSRANRELREKASELEKVVSNQKARLRDQKTQLKQLLAKFEVFYVCVNSYIICAEHF